MAEHTCKHDICLHTGYSVRTSGGLRKHHRKLRLHPCCQNDKKCDTGKSIRKWTDKPVLCTKSKEFKCQHFSCSSEGFSSVNSRTNHHIKKHDCPTGCKLCLKRQKKKATMQANVELSNEVKQVIQSIDFEKLRVERILRKSIDFSKAIVITTEEVTGDTVCYPYRSAAQSTVAGIRNSMPALAPQQQRFLRSMEECLENAEVLNKLHTVDSYESALQLLKQNEAM